MMMEASSTELPAEFTRVADPHAAAAAARAAGQLVVWIPRSVRSKEKLLAILAQGLHFPTYFGRNWDALEECLQDLSWLPEKAQASLIHEQFPFGAGDNRCIYGDILKSALQRSDGRKLHVILPESN